MPRCTADDAALITRWSAPSADRRRSRHRFTGRIPSVMLLGLVLCLLGLAIGVIGLGLRLGPVLSGSMRPGIQPGDLVITEPVLVTDLRPGDVVSFYPPGREIPVIHRLLSVTQKTGAVWITTKGDANDAADPWGEVMLQGSRTWRLVAVLPSLGYVPLWFQGLRAPLLVLAGLVLAFSGLRAVRRPTVVMHPRLAHRA